MTLRKLSVAAAFLALSALFSPGASAGDPPIDPRLEEARKKLEEARKLLLKKKQELEGKGGASGTGGKASTGGKKNEPTAGSGGKAPDKKDVKGGTGGKAEEKTEAKADAALAELDRTRDDRRRATVARLRARWGTLVDNDAARQELKVHAERVARLARLRSLAEEKKKLPLIETIDGLVTKEELRHGTTMNALRSAAGGK